MPWWRACRPPRGPLDLEQPAACCEGGSVSLAIRASSEGILSRESAANALIRERSSPPNRQETLSFGCACYTDTRGGRPPSWGEADVGSNGDPCSVGILG